MTDTVPKQAVIDAVAGRRVIGGGVAAFVAYNRGIDDALAVIHAMPTAQQITDRLSRYQKGYNSGVEEAARALEADAGLCDCAFPLDRAIRIIRALQEKSK